MNTCIARPFVSESLARGLARRQSRELNRGILVGYSGKPPQGGCQRGGARQRRLVSAVCASFGPALVRVSRTKSETTLLLLFPDDYGGFELDVNAFHRRRPPMMATIGRISRHAAERYFQRTHTTAMGALFEEFAPWADAVLSTHTNAAPRPVRVREMVATKTGRSPTIVADDGVLVAATWLPCCESATSGAGNSPDSGQEPRTCAG